MADPGVCILDDDPDWLEQHRQWLERYGFRCYTFRNSEDAVRFVKDNLDVQFGLIDEILQTPDRPDNPSEQQRWQGAAAIRAIEQSRNMSRSGIWFVFITAYFDRDDLNRNEQKAEKRLDLGCSSRVVRILDKSAFIANPDKAYEILAGLLWQLAHSQSQFDQGVNMTTFNNCTIGSGANGNVNVNSFVNQQVGIRNNTNQLPSSVTLSEIGQLATEICQVLTRLAAAEAIVTESDRHLLARQAVQQIEQQPALKQRIVAALKAGGMEALKQACQHPVSAVAIAMFEGWIEPQ